MKPKPQGIEALTIRRAVVADTDKVRYRVYSTPTEFMAVIAESALMAVKVSGISKPHKIVRDLPTEGITIGAQKMAVRDAGLARVSMTTKQPEAPQSRLVAEIPTLDPDAKQAAFRPMHLGDLQRGGSVRARILPPELLNEIIEQHSKASLPPQPVDEPSPPPVSASVTEVSAPVPVVAVPEPEPTPEPAPQVSTEERVMQLAEEMLPTAAAAEDANAVLSPEEVEKLLNG